MAMSDGPLLHHQRLNKSSSNACFSFVNMQRGFHAVLAIYSDELRISDLFSL